MKWIHMAVPDEIHAQIEELCLKVPKYQKGERHLPNVSAFVRDAILVHIECVKEMDPEDLSHGGKWVL